MPNRKRSHRSRSPSRHHDRSLSHSPPKRRKTPCPPPSPGGKSLESNLQTLQQMQTEMTKTSERISTMESLFEQHSRTSRHHILLLVTKSGSALAYSDGELLDYSEDDVSSATGPQDRAIKPNCKAIKPSHTVHEKPKHLRKLNQMDRLVITLPLPRRCTTPIQQNHHGILKRNYPRS